MWHAIRYATNSRVVNNPGTKDQQYHRGDNGAVRVYREREAAENRAEKLNAKEAGQ